MSGIPGAGAGAAGGLVLAASACAVEGTVVAAGTLAGAVLDLGLWAGFGLISAMTSGPHVNLARRQVDKAPDAILQDMKYETDQMNNSFTVMQESLVGLAADINEKKWAEVAAKSTMVIATGKKFSLAAKLALEHAGCTHEIVVTECKAEYYVCDGSDCNSKGCLMEPFDCYSTCCKQQRDYCGGDNQCLLDRGCGKGQVHPPSFQTQYCRLLQETQGNFEEATTEVQSMHDCACELKGDAVQVKGCGFKFEEKVRQQVKQSMRAVMTDLDGLSRLYKGAAAPELFLPAVSSGTGHLAQNLALACKKVKRLIPQCNLFPAPALAPEHDSGSGSLLLVLPLMSAVFLVGMVCCSWGSPTVSSGERSSLRQTLLTVEDGCDAQTVNSSARSNLEEEEQEGSSIVFMRCKEKLASIVFIPQERSSIVFFAFASIVFILQLTQAYQACQRMALPSHPREASRDASTDCLARSHAVQQTFDTCQGALAILMAAVDGREAMNVTLTKIVSSLARDFPELANVVAQ